VTRVFIGVGSNITPEASVEAAIRLLACQVRVIDVSTFYRTPAEGRPEQPDYVNGVVVIETDLPPETLKHEVLRAIEHRLGRRRTGDKFAPRPIDLDILLYGSRQMQTADLHLSAEDIEKRSFVAIPLAEVAPDLTMPGTGIRLQEIAARFSRSQMTPVALTNDVRREWAASGGANECQQSQAAHS
jgi:2-amino-4-hydroxy-6-hydroxymethyldihydropteridine diphosphokinase